MVVFHTGVQGYESAIQKLALIFQMQIYIILAPLEQEDNQLFK